jgi:two-component sensor histidine kinase
MLPQSARCLSLPHIPAMKEVKLALSAVNELLHSYADAHRALQMPEADGLVDAATYLRRLCLSISRSKLDHLQIHLVLAACPLLLRSDRCWRLGMIVCTNS